MDRQATNYTVRDLLGEDRSASIMDTTLNRLVHFAQHETMLALMGHSAWVIDTITTTNTITRYLLTHTSATPQDTVLTGHIGAVIHKQGTQAGGNETALRFIPPELIGHTLEGVNPATYSLIGRNLLLGRSPSGSDSLFVYMYRVPRDLSANTTALTVAKEDQFAVVLYASMLASLRIGDLQGARFYQELWANHINKKKPGVPNVQN